MNWGECIWYFKNQIQILKNGDSHDAEAASCLIVSLGSLFSPKHYDQYFHGNNNAYFSRVQSVRITMSSSVFQIRANIVKILIYVKPVWCFSEYMQYDFNNFLWITNIS